MEKKTSNAGAVATVATFDLNIGLIVVIFLGFLPKGKNAAGIVPTNIASRAMLENNETA